MALDRHVENPITSYSSQELIHAFDATWQRPIQEILALTLTGDETALGFFRVLYFQLSNEEQSKIFHGLLYTEDNNGHRWNVLGILTQNGRYFDWAIKQQCPTAYYFMGADPSLGNTVREHYLKTAIDMGSPLALSEHANQYAYQLKDESYLPAKKTLALQEFMLVKKAAEKNFPPALNRLGEIYCEGIVEEKNRDIAKKYFEEAIKGGNVTALINLANIHYNQENLAEARLLYAKATMYHETLGFKGLSSISYANKNDVAQQYYDDFYNYFSKHAFFADPREKFITHKHRLEDLTSPETSLSNLRYHRAMILVDKAEIKALLEKNPEQFMYYFTKCDAANIPSKIHAYLTDLVLDKNNNIPSHLNDQLIAYLAGNLIQNQKKSASSLKKLVACIHSFDNIPADETQKTLIGIQTALQTKENTGKKSSFSFLSLFKPKTKKPDTHAVSLLSSCTKRR